MCSSFLSISASKPDIVLRDLTVLFYLGIKCINFNCQTRLGIVDPSRQTGTDSLNPGY